MSRSTISNEQIAQTGSRKDQKLSDIKHATLSPQGKSPEMDRRNGCEVNNEVHTTLDIKTTDITTNTSPAASPPGSPPGRPGAPHYCEICGKVRF